ncbi:MAG: hypothetical protein HY814_08460 [Candidatus Riflebacteria bacterium]|nr:hypothetical protein [Candidatus Riflebacteria bacterium]
MDFKDDPLFAQIFELLHERYGELSPEEMKSFARLDGLGDLLEEVEEMVAADPELVAACATGFPAGLVNDGVDVMPASEHPVTLHLELDDEILFDQKECLRTCAGNCCKGKNYLMIGLPDIFRIVSAPAMKRLGVHSTDDLYRRDPPLVQLFFNEEYGLFLPYLRFLAVGADRATSPEDAPQSVCPFLAAIEEVCSYNGKKVPDWAGQQAQGCVLLRHKPKVCRLSPVGKCAGLVTGRLTYEYAPPALECPACQTRVSIKLTDHLSGATLRGEDSLDARLHRIVMTREVPLSLGQRGRYEEILKEMYNIDELLASYGIDRCQRPSLDAVIDIAVQASELLTCRWHMLTRAYIARACARIRPGSMHWCDRPNRHPPPSASSGYYTGVCQEV